MHQVELRHLRVALLFWLLPILVSLFPGCSDREDTGAATDHTTRPEVDESSYHVHPGDDIQQALDKAAADPVRKIVNVHAGTYRPRRPGQALVCFLRRHDGITLLAHGEVILTAANPDLADRSLDSFPAIVNHVVFFGDGISSKTVLRGFKITGANHYVTRLEEPERLGPPADVPELHHHHPHLALFFFADGGGIKVFGRSYPTIEDTIIFDNYASPCAGGASIEHRGFTEQPVTFRNCVFQNNRCQVTGSAIDVLPGSAAVIENCLFVGNISNTGEDYVSPEDHPISGQYGSGALTVFHESSVRVRRCTFTDNWNGVDDRSSRSTYTDCIFWQNTHDGGISSGGRYELDILAGSRVTGCFIHGNQNDLNGNIESEDNVLDASDPNFDRDFRPWSPEFSDVGYRPQ